MPGLANGTDLVLKKGVFTRDNLFYELISKINLNTYERLTIVIRLLDESGEPRLTWTLRSAFVKQLTCTDLNSQSSEVAVESIVVSYDEMIMESA
jgi:phage tail-like protein